MWLNIGQLGIVIKWEKVKEHLCIERKRGKVILKQDNVCFNASLTRSLRALRHSYTQVYHNGLIN